MTNNTCTTCGGEMLTNSGQSFCPVCLLQQGMRSSTYGGNGPRVAWKPPEVEQLTAAFPNLEIQQLLGVGGMGAVFKVRQKELDRVAALKVLPGEMATTPGFAERFLREARLLASLSHPHIVTVYEFGQRDGIYFLLMEFVDGVTLRQALRAEPIKKLGSKETLAIVGQLCEALQFAHDEGVVHRDIKPENILIDKRGRIKIADFGLARLLGQSPTMPTLTGTHQLMGTPAYMAPEQIEGLPGIDHRADIYSMGVVFYELLTGELPLGRFSPPSERAETDVRLDEVVLRTLAREPDRRYQQASEVKTDMETVRNLIAAAQSGAAPAKRRPWALSRTTVSFLAGVIVTGCMFIGLRAFLQKFEESLPLYSQSRSEADALISASLAKAVLIPPDVTSNALTLGGGASGPMSMPGGMMSSGDVGGMGSSGMGSSGMGRGGMAGGGMAGGGMGMGADMDGGMGGIMGAGSIQSRETNSAIDFDESSPSLNASMFSLSAEQLAKVNEILKATHERYLKEEALHSTISVDSSGVQITEINPFPEQLRPIENDLWTQLDDAVPVETQKELRDKLNLFETLESETDSGMGRMSGSGGMGMPGMGGGGMMSGYSAASGLPGLLGWKQELLPVTVEVGHKGRWFLWKVTRRKEQEGPVLPGPLMRFLREPGPWMAVANAKAAYESQEWMKVADCFTPTGKFRWYMAESWAVKQDEFRDFNDDQRSAYKSAMESLSTFLEKARPVDEISEQIERQLHAVQSRLIDGQPDDIDAILQESALSFSEDLGNAWFLLSVVHSATRGVRPFEPATHALINVQLETHESAAGYFQRTGKDALIPVRFRLDTDQWKIDSIGTSVELQQQVRIAQERENGASPRATADACSQAMADGRYHVAAQCMTDLARDEWLGEMLVAILKNNGIESLHSRYLQTGALPSSEQIDLLIGRLKEIMPQTIGSGTFQSMLENPALTANERREVTDQIAKKFPDRDSLLQLLLATRAIGQPDEFKIKGTFSNSSDTEPSITKTGTWTWHADSGLPPVEIRLLQLDGVLWKLDSIIDPALKPWPLVEIPSTPKTE